LDRPRDRHIRRIPLIRRVSTPEARIYLTVCTVPSAPKCFKPSLLKLRRLAPSSTWTLLTPPPRTSSPILRLLSCVLCPSVSPPPGHSSLAVDFVSNQICHFRMCCPCGLPKSPLTPIRCL
jgi:hypothetical protein